MSKAELKRQHIRAVVDAIADAAERDVPFDVAWAQATDGFVKHVDWFKPDVRELHEMIISERAMLREFNRDVRAIRRERSGVRTRAEQSKVNKRKWASGIRWE